MFSRFPMMKKVLVIENDAPLSWSLERMLRGKYFVTVMNNGLAAWAWLSEGNNCDLIISDINMPSLDGVELLESIKNDGPFKDLPVIMLLDSDETKNECFKLGAFGYLLMPFVPQKFLIEVTRALEHNAHDITLSVPIDPVMGDGKY